MASRLPSSMFCCSSWGCHSSTWPTSSVCGWWVALIVMLQMGAAEAMPRNHPIVLAIQEDQKDRRMRIGYIYQKSVWGKMSEPINEAVKGMDNSLTTRRRMWTWMDIKEKAATLRSGQKTLFQVKPGICIKWNGSQSQPPFTPIPDFTMFITTGTHNLKSKNMSTCQASGGEAMV